MNKKSILIRLTKNIMRCYLNKKDIKGKNSNKHEYQNLFEFTGYLNIK